MVIEKDRELGVWWPPPHPLVGKLWCPAWPGPLWSIIFKERQQQSGFHEFSLFMVLREVKLQGS